MSGNMKIIPELTEYNFEIMKHTAKAMVEHIAGVRKASYFFDDKLIGERTVEDGGIMTDDDCIADIMSEYCKNNKGVYADIYSKHADKIQLVNKLVHLKIDSGAFVVDFSAKCEKGVFTFSITTSSGRDRIVCRMEANDFLEAFEKSRFLLYGMEGMNEEISKHINELARDEIMEIIKWK